METTFGPYNAPTITEPFTLYDMQMMNTNSKEHFTTTDNQIQPSKIIISPYLEKYIKLWVWDWDDTLIDVNAYIRHHMDRNTILKLSDQELEFDVPNHKYFKYLVEYLVSSGRRVGFASFGTYSVIRAYMDRIFGFGQKFFTEVNIYAACRDIDGTCEVRSMPLNKNAYIQRLMKFYAIDDARQVVLFDDRPTNISDVARMGVIPIQIEGTKLNDDTRNNLQAKSSILFGPIVMMDLEARIRGMCKDNPTEYDKSFGQLGDFKVMKYGVRDEGHLNNKQVEPNFNLEAFKEITSRNKNNNSKNKKLTENDIKANKINKILEGFDNEIDNNYNLFNNKYFDYMSDIITGGIFKDSNSSKSNCENGDCNGTLEQFAGCMSCQSHGSTWFACGLFIIMIAMIIAIFYV